MYFAFVTAAFVFFLTHSLCIYYIPLHEETARLVETEIERDGSDLIVSIVFPTMSFPSRQLNATQ